jgi:PAS domain S-box-containing protein
VTDPNDRLRNETTAAPASQYRLRPVEKALASAFTKASVGLAITHTNGKAIYVNNALSHLTGYSSSELLNQPFALPIHPDEQERFSSQLNELISGHIGSLSTQLRCTHKEGGVIWCKLHTTLLYDQAGQADRLLSLLDEGKKQLQGGDAQLKLLALVDNSLHFMAIADLEGRVTYINKAGRTLVGLGKSDGLEARSVADFYSAEQYTLIRDVAVPTLLRQGHWSGRVNLKHLTTGEIIPCQASGTRIDDPETGKPIGRGFTLRDLRSELIAQETQQKLLTLVDNSIELMSILELDGTNSYINKAGMAMLGFESAQQVQQTPIAQLHAPEHFALVEQEVLPSVMTTGRWSGEMSVRHLRTGEVFPVFNNTIRIDDPQSGQPIAVGAVMRDRRPELRAQQALAESEARFRNLIMQAPVAMAVFRGDDFVFDTVNEAYLPLIGKTRAEVAGKPLFTVLPETRSALEPRARELVRTGLPFPATEFELVINRHGRNETCYFNSIWEPFRLSDGRIDGFIVVAHEVTQQVVARKMAQASEAKLRSLIEEAPVATCLFAGPELVIELANEPMIRFFGRGPRIVGQPVRSVLTGSGDDASAIGLLEQVFTTGNSFAAATAPATLTLDGVAGTYYFDLSLIPLRDGAGQVYAILETAVDVTGQVLARKKIEEAQAGLRGAVELAQLGTWSIDVATGGLTYSDRLIEWFGYDPGAKHYTQVIPMLEPGDQARITRALAWALTPESDGIYDEVYTVIHLRTDQKRVLHAQGKIVFDASGRAVRLNGTAQDITLQRELQLALEQQVQQRTQELEAANEELAEANALLFRSNENLQQFAYVASHDLQEPLRKIQQFGDLLKNQYGPQSDEGALYLDRMQSSAARMTRLIKDLLTYARLSSQADRGEPVSLNQVVQTVLTDLELMIAETGAELAIGDLPSLKGDRSQLEQLFQNLLSNALKFRQVGRSGVAMVPRIRLEASQLSRQDLPVGVKPVRSVPTYYQIEVSDNGIGFEQKYVDRIFQVFQRLHGKGEYVGTGIGLAICAKVAANHGGAIAARSRPGQGATFTIYLPA